MCANKRPGRGRARTRRPDDPPVRLDVDGVAVTLVRKDVVNVNLRIAAATGAVTVSAPHGFPQSEVERLVRAKRAWIDRRRRELAQSPSALAERATPEQQRAWRRVVEACVPALVEEWAVILDVTPGALVYRNMKSRWGSCQPATGRICINTRLALYPPECLEYVVVHELCHLLVADHGPRFRELMDRAMPDWKQRRAKLR